MLVLFHSGEILGMGYIDVIIVFSDRKWATESNGTFVFVIR